MDNCGVVSFNGKSETKTYTEVIFKFQVDATFSNLSASPYSVYQQFLYDKIMELREQGLNFKQIADWLNENNYKTTRGKKFLNAHAISIVAKKQRRDAKFAKRYPLKLSNFSIHLVDKTLINKN